MTNITNSHRASIFRSTLVVAAVAGSIACGGSSQAEAESADSAQESEENALSDAPDWVLGDCRDQFKGDAVLCGVGSVSGVASPSLARNTAMARGRTEIARYLQIEVKSVLTDYQAAKGGAIEQEIEDESQQIAEMTLTGTRMVKYHLGKDGTYYALMTLELESYEKTIAGAQSIDEPLKIALVNKARKSFSSRDSEVSRY